jgi:hypothetical protein
MAITAPEPVLGAITPVPGAGARRERLASAHPPMTP